METVKPIAGEFASIPYWSEDKFEVADLPSSLGKPNLRILISGGGDGGLQDFLRLTFRREDRRPFSAGDRCNDLSEVLIISEEFRVSTNDLLDSESSNRPIPGEFWERGKGVTSLNIQHNVY
jgi:hypothetical protein